jgi:hypothetical protein
MCGLTVIHDLVENVQKSIPKTRTKIMVLKENRQSSTK